MPSRLEALWDFLHEYFGTIFLVACAIGYIYCMYMAVKVMPSIPKEWQQSVQYACIAYLLHYMCKQAKES